MNDLPSFSALVDSFSKLPGVGAKSAERMAYSVLEMDEDDAIAFSDAIKNVKTRISRCPKCGLFQEDGECEVCGDIGRNHDVCIVVAQPRDALAFEKLNDFKGVYHVLGGVLSPTKGVGPEELKIDELLNRIEEEGIKELIIATNPNMDGETTALFIAKLLEGKNVAVTRLAYGLPMGASLDYADTLTLGKALEGRRKL